MKNSREILTSVLKTTQMGQIGIRSVLDTSMRPGLRKALESQLREYDSIETEAHSIATQRGWDMDELDPSVRLWSNLMTRMKLNGRNTDSKIADMMIQGNTKGMIKGLKTLHQFGQQDEQINTLSQKLLDCENANIRQMQGYLWKYGRRTIVSAAPHFLFAVTSRPPGAYLGRRKEGSCCQLQDTYRYALTPAPPGFLWKTWPLRSPPPTAPPSPCA